MNWWAIPQSVTDALPEAVRRSRSCDISPLNAAVKATSYRRTDATKHAGTAQTKSFAPLATSYHRKRRCQQPLILVSECFLRSFYKRRRWNQRRNTLGEDSRVRVVCSRRSPSPDCSWSGQVKITCTALPLCQGNISGELHADRAGVGSMVLERLIFRFSCFAFAAGVKELILCLVLPTNFRR